MSACSESLAADFVLRADYVRNVGTHFIIGRIIGTVPFNPVVGGPEIVKNLESSVQNEIRRVAGEFGEAFCESLSVPRVVHVVAIVQLCQRRSDPVFQWTDRFERSPAGVWSNAKRSASSVYFLGSVSTAVGRARCRRSSRSLRQCRSTSCCRTAVRVFVSCSGTRARGSFTRARN